MHTIGIVGLGHLGTIHLQQWLRLVNSEHIICFDTDAAKLESISKEYHVNTCTSYQELLNFASIVDVVTPTQYHHLYASQALSAAKHVFIEKPVTIDLEELNDLIDKQRNAGTLVQIGHIERYNPAYRAVENLILDPMFFEIHRLAPFVSRGTEVSVIMDLMIHDLDIVLHLVDSPLKSLAANGVAILSKTPDIANVRLEFENGCVANLTASRISMKKMRKMRIFNQNGYTSIDFLDKVAESFMISDHGEGISFKTNENEDKVLNLNSYNNLDRNAMFDELSDFFERIVNRDSDTLVNLISATKTMDLSLRIQQILMR